FADVRKVRLFLACKRVCDSLVFPLRRRGQPSRSKPGGRAVEATRKSVRPGDERPAGAANPLTSHRRTGSAPIDVGTATLRAGMPRVLIAEDDRVIANAMATH